MLGHDRAGLSRLEPPARRHLARLRRWRALPDEVQRQRIWSGSGDFVPSKAPAGRRIRAGLWCPCLGLGGAEAWQLALARAVDPGVVCWRGAAVLEGRGASDPRMLGELSSLMPVGHGLDAARVLASTCDVIVSWAVADVAGLLAGLEPPPKVVMACHFPGESPWGRGTSDLLRGVDRLVAVSELALESIPDPERSRAKVIWNAVDAGRMDVGRDRATVRASWGIPMGRPVAGYLGRLAPEKDPVAMIRLAAGLPEPWHVAIVGEGSERAALADRARAVAPGRVHLVGGDPAAGDVLGAFDSLVVPSRFESFGLTMAEGFWAGVPVVATRSGLAKIEPGLARMVAVDAGAEELAAAVLADRRDEAGTRSRVDRARAFARDRLGLDRFGREWTDILAGLVGRGSAAVSRPNPEVMSCPA